MSGLFMLMILAFVIVGLAPRALNVDRGAILTNTNAGTLVRQVDKKVYFLQAEVAPLTAILQQTGAVKKILGFQYDWYEKDMGTPLTTALNASVIGAATVVVAAGTGTSFCINDIIMHQASGMLMLVTNVVADTLTITRAYGTTADANIAANDVIVLLAPAYAENALSQRAIAMTPTLNFNYAQIFRHFAEVSRRENESERYDIGMPRMAERRKEAMIFHMEARERAYFFGELRLDATGATPRTMTRGIKASITTNRVNLLGALTKDKIDAAHEQTTLFGPGKKDWHMSGSFMRAFHKEILGGTATHLNLSPDSEKYGLHIYEYVTPFGILNLILNRMLTQVEDGSSFIIDRDNVKRFGQTDTIIKHNVQPPDQDGFKDEILTDDGIQVSLQRKFSYIYNP